MSSFNKVILMGNLTRDVELRFLPGGTAVAKIGLAVNRKYRDVKTSELREEVTYVDIECFGKQAETLSQYTSKGKPLLVEGRLKLDSWDDKQTGKKQYKLKVVCEQFQLMGASGAAAASTEQRAKPQPQQRTAPAPQTQNDGFESEFNVPQENIPF